MDEKLILNAITVLSVFQRMNDDGGFVMFRDVIEFLNERDHVLDDHELDQAFAIWNRLSVSFGEKVHVCNTIYGLPWLKPKTRY